MFPNSIIYHRNWPRLIFLAIDLRQYTQNRLVANSLDRVRSGHDSSAQRRTVKFAI